MSGFCTSDKKGFHITFENGWTASVQFGSGNYGSNYDWRPDDRRNDSAPEAVTAEIAAWDWRGNWHTFADGNEVQGYQRADQVLAFFNEIAGKERTL